MAINYYTLEVIHSIKNDLEISVFPYYKPYNGNYLDLPKEVEELCAKLEKKNKSYYVAFYHHNEDGSCCSRVWRKKKVKKLKKENSNKLASLYFEAERKGLEVRIKPQIDAIKKSQQLSAKDYAVRINAK